MYYRLGPSSNPEQIGHVDQQFSEAEYPVDINHPDFLGNKFLQKVDVGKTIACYPKLKSKAKITDLINGVWYNSSGGLLLSEKLKLFFEQENHPCLQFIPTHIFHKGKGRCYQATYLFYLMAMALKLCRKR